MIVAN